MDGVIISKGTLYVADTLIPPVFLYSPKNNFGKVPDPVLSVVLSPDDISTLR